MKKTVITIAAIFMLAAAPSVSAATTGASTEVCARDTEADKVDQLLNSYEKFVDRYVATCKKINEGDTSALATLASMQKEAERLQKQIDSLDQAEYTPAQLTRLQKIQEKLLNAM